MKKLFIPIFILATAVSYGQEFEKNLTTARSAYNSGNLNDARFAMEQMLRDLDMAIGKEILKILPTKLGDRNFNEKDDNVTGSAMGVGSGLFVHRSYGEAAKSGDIEIINNSPMITSINAILALPFVGNSSDGSQKVVKVQGYKAVLNRNENSETGKAGYSLQVPLNNTLVVFNLLEASESEITQLANSIPLSKIQQMAQ
ncbi:MAG: hypothetical protein HC811_07290 [Flammeovirgaceae bacterium]|nr:hypothetical protein [Flammeovirgaceae bacterium]